MSAQATRLDRTGSVDFADTEPVPVPLGDHVYDVVPQRLGRVRSRMGVELRDLTDLGNIEGGIEGFVSEGLARVHRFLGIFVPDLMELHEFEGYGSAGALERDEYVEVEDRGPTLPQIVNAVERVLEVNRIDLLRHLKNVFSPDLLRAMVQEQAVKTVWGSETPSSPTSSSTPTPASPSIPSGTEAPTEPESPSGSPSLASTPS